MFNIYNVIFFSQGVATILRAAYGPTEKRSGCDRDGLGRDKSTKVKVYLA